MPLRLSVRHIVHEPNPPDLPYREEHFGYVHLPVSVSLEQAALVLVDCWDQIIVESFQERAERICDETIRPVLEASRSAGITVIHAPSPPVAEKFREFWPPEAVDERAPEAVAATDWPPADFAMRRRDWAHLQARRSGLHQEQLDRIDRDRSIHPAVLPEAGDLVIATGEQLHRICRERGILLSLLRGVCHQYLRARPRLRHARHARAGVCPGAVAPTPPPASRRVTRIHCLRPPAS